MSAIEHADVEALERAFDAIERDAGALVDGLTEAQGVWRASPESWSIAQCLDHLATANRVYLNALEPPAGRALQQGRGRRGPAVPGLIGGWFVWSLEPPVKPLFRSKAPKKIVPRASPPLGDSVAQFLASHEAVRDFLGNYADIDLAGVPFVNPFIPWVRFSLATGLHVIAAHERRHLWQAWNVRARLLDELGRGEVHPLHQ